MASEGVGDTSARSEVYDPAMLAELEDVFGHDHLMQLLSLLRVEIGERFRIGNDEPSALGRDAHALLSSSGSLGFLDLSHRCSDIERACIAGTDVSVLLRDVRAAAVGALAAISTLEARDR
ncbi:Hpt domain-containing protein [Methylobacterium marchantiae]|uniref:Hpt domain-containing protein n=1 Tax=Methylobacterium marchantiae TaxID=600331 RepID=A0ABW3WZL7_9HYPH|nr:hypothetical protein AIGOOFII_2134 [Methylobacterium marchantiae]